MSKKVIYLCSFVLVLGLALTSIVEAADPSLVGWWRLDGNADDSSGNNNHGTLFGNPQWVAGKIGGALQFDGTGVDIDCGNGPSLDITGEITIAAWIYLTGSGESNFPRIVDKSSGLSSTGPGYKIYLRGADNYIVTLSAGGTVMQSSSPIVLDTWNYLALIITGTQWKFFLNGTWEQWNETALPSSVSNSLSIGTGSTADRHFEGLMDDVRIYNRALTQEEVLKAMEGPLLAVASDPKPDDEAIDVPRDVTLSWAPGEFAPAVNGHIVYLSENFNNVNDGIGGITQDANSFTPARRLDFDTTYYWRVDEVNAPPASTVFEGNVWSFTTEPIAYPIDGNNITATASSTRQTDTGPENTINGLGLDVNDLHSMEPTDMWLSSEEPNAWIEYELDKIHKLHEMWVWNYNQMMESLFGFGLKDVTIEYSTNGTDYMTLAGVPEFAQALETPDYAHNTTVDFNGVAAKYVRLTANSNWGSSDRYGLSEVRFFHIPVYAREPSPDSEATDVAVDVTLGFRAGREADTHDVYLDSDEQAMIDANVPVTNVAETSYGPLSLDLATTYYWKINEVNETETTTTWQGEIWNFTTQEYLVVEDFEDYNDYPPNEIWSTWVDGYGVPTNGATAGYPEPIDFLAGEHYMETMIVHGGSQSMPFFYDNTGTATYSEGERTFAVPQDWTKAGVQTLVLYFQGTAGNTGQLYVEVNGSKVVYDGDAVDVTRPRWKQWNIDLASHGVDLQSVTTLAIGIDGSGASGRLYFDEIRLYRLAPEIVVPSEEIWIEAEAANTIEAPMQIFDDPTASGGKYIMKDPAVDESFDNPPADGLVTYTFTVAGGTYKIAGRVISNGVNDSFWVRIPGATTQTTNHSSGWIRWAGMTQEVVWGWEDVFSDSDTGNPTVEFTMPAGTHTLELRYREDLTKLDVLVITSID